MEKILEVQDLEKFYGKKENITRAIDGVTFQVLNGEFIGIMGSSGSGKTTLLNCIATITRPTAGRILLKGEDLSTYKGKKLAEYRGSRIGYLFQNFELIENMTVKENILLPLAIHNQVNQESKKQIVKLAQYLEIADLMDKFPEELSGGQKQRVSAARAMVSKPEILLADEPTGALDSKNAKALMKKLQEINEKEKSTILMVTHDANAASYCSRILFIQDGAIFHELRRKHKDESKQEFYERIIGVMATLGGGSENVL